MDGAYRYFERRLNISDGNFVACGKALRSVITTFENQIDQLRQWVAQLENRQRASDDGNKVIDLPNPLQRRIN
jgi:hypothetical protein